MRSTNEATAWKLSQARFLLRLLSQGLPYRRVQVQHSSKNLIVLKKCVNYPSILHTEAIWPRAERNCIPWIKETNSVTYISNIIRPPIRLPSPRNKKKKRVMNQINLKRVLTLNRS